MMPPSGVLNAAAMPAPAPAAIRSRLGAMRPKRRPASMCMMEAPTCTDGPSRPMEAPTSRPPRVRNTLAMASRRDKNCLRTQEFSALEAAIACGMPLPSVPRKKRSVSQAMSANPAGARKSVSQGCAPISSRWKSIARSAPFANRMDSVPASRAAPTRRSFFRQFRGDNNGNMWREPPEGTCKILRMRDTRHDVLASVAGGGSERWDGIGFGSVVNCVEFRQYGEYRGDAQIASAVECSLVSVGTAIFLGTR